MKTVFRIVSLVLPCILFLFTTGCSPQKEVGNLAIVTGMFLDYSTETKTYQILAEIADFSEYETSSTVSSKWVKSEGSTLFQAFYDLEKASPNPFYFSHAKMLLLGSGFQKISTRHTIDFFLQSPGIHSDILVCITRLSGDGLKKLSEKTVFGKLYDVVQRNYNTDSCQLYQLYNKETEPFFLPEITIPTEESTALSTAVFSNHLYVTTFEKNEELLLNLLTKTIQNKPISTPNFHLLIKDGNTALTAQNGTLFADCMLTVQLADTKTDHHSTNPKVEIQKELETTLQHTANALFEDLKSKNQTQILWGKSPTETMKLRCFITIEDATLLKGR